MVCITAWLVPGAGHLLQGRRQKGLVFLVTLPLMFGIGLWLQGRLFPLELDAGAGTVTAASYEYGNTFLMTAGLLNFLVILDAFDVALGRK